MKKVLFLLLLVNAHSNGFSQEISLVKDINPSGNSYPSSFVNIGNEVVFVAYDEAYGYELRVTSGTENTTMLLKDINPGGSSNPDYLTKLGDDILFSANNGVNGQELWISDGTESGTKLLKNIGPGENYNGPSFLTNMNGKIYFQANDGVNGNELWVSDGTENGTLLLKDINPTGSSNLYGLTNCNGKLYFGATDGVNGTELWITDGTENGTVLLKEINPAGNFSMIRFTNVGGRIFFLIGGTYTPGYINEIWITDGTQSGTGLVKAIYPSVYGSVHNLFSLNDKLYFNYNINGGSIELWESDGTEAGTKIVDVDYNLHQFINVADGGYVLTEEGELWKTDDLLEDASLYDANSSIVIDTLLGYHNGILYMAGNDGQSGYELYKLDVSTGIMDVADFEASQVSMYAYQNQLFVKPGEKVEQINVYNVTGQLLYQTNLQGKSRVTLPNNVKGFVLIQYLQEGEWSSLKHVIE